MLDALTVALKGFQKKCTTTRPYMDEEHRPVNIEGLVFFHLNTEI